MRYVSYVRPPTQYINNYNSVECIKHNKSEKRRGEFIMSLYMFKKLSRSGDVGTGGGEGGTNIHW